MSIVTRYLLQQLRRCNPDSRARVYAGVAREYGQGFADRLRDEVEAHHLIVENERGILRNRRRRRIRLARAK